MKQHRPVAPGLLRGASLAAALALLLLAFGAVSAGAPYNLLVNPGLEQYGPPYALWHGVDCQVAAGWQRYWTGAPQPAWMDTRVFADWQGTDHVERIEGATSQLIVATLPYTAGVMQQVSGLAPGVDYGFHAAIVTVYRSAGQDPVDGKMIKRVGMDPTGAADPRAPTVVWSESDDRDRAWDLDARVAAPAGSPTVTVFIEVISPFPAGPWPFMNQSFLDSAILARTPVVTATSPLTCSPTFPVRWDNARPAPGGGVLRWYDVQVMDGADGTWHDWVTHTLALDAPFVGQLDHTYRFRARAWQKYPNGAHLYGPYRPEGDTATHVVEFEHAAYLPLVLRH